VTLLSHFNSISHVVLAAYMQPVHRLAVEIGQPSLQALVRRFLYDQHYPDDELPSEDVALDECPEFSDEISIYYSARSTFYAPSELAGPNGLHTEIVRSTPLWYGGYERRDTVLIQDGPEDGTMGGMVVGRVLNFLAFVDEDTRYPCALVETFLPVGGRRDPTTNMWVVQPERVQGKRSVRLVHLDCVVRGCHLVPVFGQVRVPVEWHFADSLDAFSSFYLNQYIDYHAHECIP
jgi:hypothetical protein